MQLYEMFKNKHEQQETKITHHHYSHSAVVMYKVP